MNGSVFSKARYMNGVGFEILARTPVPQSPPLPPSPEDGTGNILFIFIFSNLFSISDVFSSVPGLTESC